jgi:hypothetical protein
MTNVGSAFIPHLAARKCVPPFRQTRRETLGRLCVLAIGFLLMELPMSITKLRSRAIAWSALFVFAPSTGYPSTSELPHFAPDRPQIAFPMLPSDNQLTDPVIRRRPVYLAGLVGREPAVPVKRSTRSTLNKLFDALFGRRDNVSRPRATATLFTRGVKPENKGSILEETQAAQPSAAPSEKALSFIAPVATPIPTSPQSPPIAPLTPSSAASKINDLPALPLE